MIFYPQILLKFYFGNDVKTLIEIADFIGDIYKQNAKSHSRYYTMLMDKYARLSVLIVKNVIAAYVILHISFTLFVVGDNIHTGAKTPLLRIYIPGVDENSMAGYAFLMAYTYLLLLFGYSVVCSFDALTFLIFANMPMVASVIHGHLDELKEALLNTKTKPNEITYRLLNVILMHKKYTE